MIRLLERYAQPQINNSGENRIKRISAEFLFEMGLKLNYYSPEYEPIIAALMQIYATQIYLTLFGTFILCAVNHLLWDPADRPTDPFDDNARSSCRRWRSGTGRTGDRRPYRW